MLTSYQREQLREEHAQNTNNFINVVLDSIGRKREIEAQQRLRDAQARQIEQMIGINNQFLPIQDPDTGVVSYQPRPTPATPFAGGVPTPQGMSYTLSPQALAQQNALNAQGAPPQPGQSPLSVVGFTSKGPRFGQSPQDKADLERMQKSREEFDNLVATSSPLFGAIDELEKRAEGLGDFKPGASQLIQKPLAGYRKFTEDPVYTEYEGYLNQKVSPIARVLGQEKGPLATKDVERIVSGVGKITAPLSVKKNLINELRKGAVESILARARVAGIPESEIESYIPGFSRERIIQANMAKYKKTRDEVIEALREKGFGV